LIKDERHQRGTINHTPGLYPRGDQTRPRIGASALILAHNHPSGDPSPSGSDISVNNDIIKMAAPLGITVHDHLIIGRGRHANRRELGLILSEANGSNQGASASPRYSFLHDPNAP
jgi:DNA repair protein RadC